MQAFARQEAAQKKQMNDMMRQMGMEIDEEQGLDEDDEMRKIMKDMGVQEDPENMDDDAILAELEMAENDEKIQQGRNLRDKAEELKTETKALNSQGKKAEALDKMREFKAAQAQYDAFIKEHPDILAEMYTDDDNQEKKPIQPKPAAKQKQLSLIEIYDKYHEVEEMNSIKVVEYELERCKTLSTNVDDDALIDALENRIDMLEIKQD